VRGKSAGSLSEPSWTALSRRRDESSKVPPFLVCVGQLMALGRDRSSIARAPVPCARELFQKLCSKVEGRQCMR
jgi:hypothetical protein